MKPIIAALAALALAPAGAALAHEGHVHQDAPAAETSVAATHETALRAVIASIQSGTIDYSKLGAELASAVRDQEATVTPMIQGLGAVQTVEHQGEEQGTQKFRVVFENAATDWFIALDADGVIQGLLFQPAE